MSNELAKANGMQITNVNDLARVSEMFAASGYFSDARDAAQAGVKILAGQGWGIAPFDAMTGVHIIQGRAAIGAHLIAAKIKASGKYDYRVRQMTDEICEIEFFQAQSSIGVSTFTLADAKKAGTKNLDKFARNMLFARAMSNGYRWYCPDVFTGPVYTPEELGASVDGEGNVVSVSRPAPAQLEVAPEDDAVFEAPVAAKKPAQEAPPLELGQQSGVDTGPITPSQAKAIAAALKPLKLDKDEARMVVESILDRELPEGVMSMTSEEGARLAEFTTDQWAVAADSFRVPA